MAAEFVSLDTAQRTPLLFVRRSGGGDTHRTHVPRLRRRPAYLSPPASSRDEHKQHQILQRTFAVRVFSHTIRTHAHAAHAQLHVQKQPLVVADEGLFIRQILRNVHTLPPAHFAPSRWAADFRSAHLSLVLATVCVCAWRRPPGPKGRKTRPPAGPIARRRAALGAPRRFDVDHAHHVAAHHRPSMVRKVSRQSKP